MIAEETCCIVKNAEISQKDYWDSSFNEVSTPNWIETDDPWIMPWIDKANLPAEAAVFCAGVGDSNIVESLIARGFTNIIANDISEVALNKLRIKHPGNEVRFVADDLVNPIKLEAFHGQIDLYIDRATLHFFTTCEEKDHYFTQLSNLLKPEGYSMLGVFSKDNLARCCGLNLQLWSVQSLQNRMTSYQHIEANEVSFTEINGNTRNYIYQFSKKSL